MPEHFPLMVPGATPDDDLMEVHAPFDRTLIAAIERGGPSVVEKALDTAYRLFRDRDAWLSAAVPGSHPVVFGGPESDVDVRTQQRVAPGL